MIYTPQIIDEKYALFAVPIQKCPICGKNMIERGNRNLFPLWFEMNQIAQAKRAGIVFKSYIKVDDENICEECEKAGKATFECYICKERKSTDKLQESFGDPPDALCKDCYNSVPASEWDKVADELRDEHRYDFE